MIELQPILKGELVELRPLKPEDFEALYQVSSDPLVWEQHPAKDRYKREVFEKFFQGALESKGAFVVSDAKTGRVIGSSRYCEYEPELQRISIGYTFLARDCWGHTYNKEMKKLMLDHIFQYVESVVFYIGANNKRSRIAIEKIGAKLILEQEGETASGEKFTEVVYEIKKQEWLKS